MSRFFISRPIFASVISIVIVIAGLMASLTLPVAQYPEITPPTVIISATFPGANAETLSRTVAAPIEEQLDRKSTRLNSSHLKLSRMPSSA